MVAGETEVPIFSQLQVEYLSKEIWRRQLKNLKTSKLRRIARDVGVKVWARTDRWQLIDDILAQPYETLEKRIDNLQ